MFQAIAWSGQDQDDQFTVRIFGRSEDGKSVSLGTKFNPFCFIKTNVSKDTVKDLFWRGLVSCRVHEGRDLWGFQNGELSRFIRLEFKTQKALKICAWCVENNKFPELSGARVYESNIDPVLRFMHVSGISSTGWIDPGICEVDAESTCEVNLWAPDWRYIKPVARDDLAPLRIMSFDIECYSSTGGFPDPKNPRDVVFQIGMTTKEFGKPGYLDRKCLCLKETAGHESFETERELIQAFQKYLLKIDPDIITGWNIFGFDLEYLLVRATIHCGLSPVWGRVQGEVVELVEKNLSSSALGNNQLKMVPMKGRYVFDLFQDVKREHKLESYSLNNVSKHFLKDQKLDMPPKEMFSRFLEGNPEKLGEVAEYCVKDTELPHALMEKLCQIQNQVEMAKACWVPLSFLSERGQQIKVFSQMAKKARELNFIIPTFRKSSGIDEGYQGATVLEAQTGAYYAPITALDFASLYPSIMCAENLCYSTLVMDPKYDNLPGVTYEQFGPHRFAQAPAPSLLPVILTDLKAFRKKAKKLMAQAEGTPLEAIYNGQQLAYKISMNSIYGFTGASKGMLPLMAIASTVTMRGRQMIEETKNYVEENFPGAKVRYGDSVMPETPVLIRINGQESRPEIQNLTNSWVPYDHFKLGIAEQCESLNIECMTHIGWKKINRIIRHKSCKKIYRVYSPYGIVDVTEDHSLLDEDLILLKPYEIKETDNLLHFGKDIEGVNYVKLIHESWDGYVYDLETDAGTFAAGNGSLIVKNTDSIMVEFDVQGRKGQDAIDYSWVQGELAAEACTKLFKAPNDLELEKVYCPYFLYSKKRYAAKMYEKKGDSVVFKKVDIKGLQVVRRDMCPFVRETLKTLLNMILESSDPRPVIDFARSAGRQLVYGKVPTEKLLMSKQLASSYKNAQPHVSVRDKMKARAPGSEPQQGDRVSFLITHGQGKMYEKAEDPVWVAEKGLKVDYRYYFTNQFKKPVADLLEPLIREDLVFDKKFLAETNDVGKRTDVKVTSSVEIEARKAFLSRFALKVSTV